MGFFSKLFSSKPKATDAARYGWEDYGSVHGRPRSRLFIKQYSVGDEKRLAQVILNDEGVFQIVLNDGIYDLPTCKSWEELDQYLPG